MLAASWGDNMNLKSFAGLSGAFILGAASMALLGGSAQAARKDDAVFRWVSVFEDALNTSINQHLQPVDAPRAAQAAIGGMLRSLDPRSDYISPEEFTLMTGAK